MVNIFIGIILTGVSYVLHDIKSELKSLKDVVINHCSNYQVHKIDS